MFITVKGNIILPESLHRFLVPHITHDINSAASFDKQYHNTVAYLYLIEMRNNYSIMNFTNLKENKKSNEHVTSSHLMANAANTRQNPYWHAQHDSKSGVQQ